jgi:hypothetical protein
MNKPKLLLYLVCALCLAAVSSLAPGKPSAVPKSQESELSPIATIKAYYDAAHKKDVKTAKKYLSQGTLEMMEEGAKKMGKTLDEALKESDADQEPMPEFSNEVIDGETATVDIKAASGASITMPFVKENDRWKIAMDKYMENLSKSSSK